MDDDAAQSFQWLHLVLQHENSPVYQKSFLPTDQTSMHLLIGLHINLFSHILQENLQPALFCGFELLVSAEDKRFETTNSC